MITENRLTAYINSLDQGDGELIEQIAETAVKTEFRSSAGRRRHF